MTGLFCHFDYTLLFFLNQVNVIERNLLTEIDGKLCFLGVLHKSLGPALKRSPFLMFLYLGTSSGYVNKLVEQVEENL